MPVLEPGSGWSGRPRSLPRVERNRQPRASNGRRLRASVYGRVSGWATFGAPRHLDPGRPRRLLVSVAALVAVAVMAFMASSSAYIGFAAQLPDARTLGAQALPQDTLIYASDGTTVIRDEHVGGLVRYYQRLEDMGTYLPEATIAIEDANFYNEPGIDAQGIVRAAWVDITTKKNLQGASSIDQQLVKQRLIGDKPTLERKIREAYLATQIDQIYSKHDILEMYLNTISYGKTAYGPEAAAKIYFHTDTAKLTLGQASMLAGIPQNPTYNNPWVNWDGARERQKEVLKAMVREHDITQEEADRAFAEDLSPPNHMYEPASINLAPSFVDYIENQELIPRYGEHAVKEGGLRVYTTLDWNLQQMAQNTMRDMINQERPTYGVSQGALVSLNPKTGEIVAMVGVGNPQGKCNSGEGVCNLAILPRNPGSTFKEFTYTTAIESGKYTMVTPVEDNRFTADIPGGSERWSPNDFAGHPETSVCQLQACLGNSYNIAAARVELSVGVPAVVDVARRMGAPPAISEESNPHCPYLSTTAPTDCYGPALTLGGHPVTVLQMAQGTAVLAAQGMLRPTFGVNRITSPDGSEIFRADPKSIEKPAVDPKVAWIMETIMSDDDNRAAIFLRGSKLTLPGRHVGAKTGTSENVEDDWTVGYTPSLTTAVWTGDPGDGGHPRSLGGDAIYVAAPIWNAYMQAALDYLKKPDEWFSEPPGLQHVNYGGKTVYLLPGTSVGQRPPPLPPWVRGIPLPSPSPSPGQPNPGPQGAN